MLHLNQGVTIKEKDKGLGNRGSRVGETAGNSRDLGEETSLARRETFSSLKSKQSRLGQGKTPETVSKTGMKLIDYLKHLN